MRQQLSPLQIVSLSTLPSASANAGALVQVSGALYWSDGTNWIQVAPDPYNNSNPSSGFSILDDFISSGVTNTSIYGPLALQVQTSGTGAAVGTGTAEPHSPGVFRASTGTTTTGRAGWFTIGTNSMLFGQSGGIGGAYDLKMRIKTDTALADGTDSYSLLMGYTDTVGSAAPNNGLFVYYDQTTTTWRFRARNAGTQTEVNTNITVAANTWYTITLTVSNAATPTATCRVVGSNSTDSGVLNITTNVPTAVVGLGLQILKSAGTTSRAFNVDYVRLSGIFSSGRP
jgi:hypothetical protein